jgi:glutamine amidotransferase
MADKKFKKVVIVDYQMGNLFSVKNACLYVGLDAEIVKDGNELLAADALILPGVGSFGQAMENLHRLDLVSPLKDFIASGRPYFGICLGLQLLFEGSEEFGHHKGLAVLEGNIVRFPEKRPNGRRIKVPHMGWNTIRRSPHREEWSESLLAGINEGAYMYFVHSYYASPTSREAGFTLTNYEGVEFCSTVSMGNLFAAQYHPEKSARDGIKIYRNFAKSLEMDEV